MNYLIFDTETTGLPKNTGQSLDLQPQVIEFYGIILGLSKGADGEVETDVIGELEFLANPGKPLPEIITKITGLKDSDLKGAPPFSENISQLQQFFSKADAAVAHNLAFDKTLINFEMQRAKFDFKWPEKLICTVEATEHIKQYRLSQAKLYEHLFGGETYPGAHRAKADVTALTRCFKELFKMGLV